MVTGGHHPPPPPPGSAMVSAPATSRCQPHHNWAVTFTDDPVLHGLTIFLGFLLLSFCCFAVCFFFLLVVLQVLFSEPKVSGLKNNQLVVETFDFSFTSLPSSSFLWPLLPAHDSQPAPCPDAYERVTLIFSSIYTLLSLKSPVTGVYMCAWVYLKHTFQPMW